MADRPRLRAAELGDAGVDGALLELLGRRPRRRWPASRPPRRSARNGWSPASAGRWSTGPARPACRWSGCRGSSSRAPRSPTWSSSPPRPPALAGVAPRVHTEIDAAAAFLTEQTETCSSRRARSPRCIAGAVPVIYGSDLTAPVARRWKTQVNENAKFPAWWGELPEADHNELLGWSGAAGDERPAAIFLEDRDQHPRVGAALRADREGDRAERRRGGAGRDGGGDADRAAALGGDAGRPGLARAGPPARRRRRHRSRRSSASRRRWDEGDGPRRRSRHAAAADHLRHAEADGPGAEPAGDGAHPAAAGQARLRARRSPTCTGSRS